MVNWSIDKCDYIYITLCNYNNCTFSGSELEFIYAVIDTFLRVNIFSSAELAMGTMWDQQVDSSFRTSQFSHVNICGLLCK